MSGWFTLNQPNYSKNQGFNLIEAAIVLGIIGLVIGGIWIAASEAGQSRKINKTIEGLVTTVKNVQQLISARDAETIGYSISITNTLNAAKAFPANWIMSSTSVQSEYGGIGVTNYITPSRFDFTMRGFPAPDCITLIVRLTNIQVTSGGRASYSTGIGLGLIQVVTTAGALLGNVTTFPATPAQAAAICVDPSNKNGIVFTFGYIRAN